jgi:hypothetical protein
MFCSPVSSTRGGPFSVGHESSPEKARAGKSWTLAEKITVIAINVIATTIFCIIFPLKGALLISANFFVGSLILRSVIKYFFCSKEAINPDLRGVDKKAVARAVARTDRANATLVFSHPEYNAHLQMMERLNFPGPQSPVRTPGMPSIGMHLHGATSIPYPCTQPIHHGTHTRTTLDSRNQSQQQRPPLVQEDIASSVAQPGESPVTPQQNRAPLGGAVPSPHGGDETLTSPVPVAPSLQSNGRGTIGVRFCPSGLDGLTDTSSNHETQSSEGNPPPRVVLGGRRRSSLGN